MRYFYDPFISYIICELCIKYKQQIPTINIFITNEVQSEQVLHKIILFCENINRLCNFVYDNVIFIIW